MLSRNPENKNEPASGKLVSRDPGIQKLAIP